MMAADPFASTAFRMAAAFAGLFSVVVAVLFAVLYLQVSRDLEGRLIQRLVQDRDALTLIDRRDGYNELARVVADEAASVRGADNVLLLLGNHGDFVAGNAKRPEEFTGIGWLPREAVVSGQEGDDHRRYVASWETVSGGRLLLAIGDGELRKTQEFLLRSLAWGLASSVLTAIAIGTLLGLRAHRRIERVGRTLTAVSAGKLAERVPLAGAGDDLDRVSGQINRTLDRLQASFESIRQSSADIAHELKTPVFRLRQRIETVRRGATGNEALTGELDRALDEIDAITSTFEALLDITQIEAGARKARFRPVDLREVAAAVADVYEAVAEDAGQRLVLVPASAPLMVHGDTELLERLLSNLVENAIRHCPPGTEISLRPGREAGAANVRVTDSGPGIPAPEREKVFERLYRLEKSRTTPGSGLGLALVKAIADLHDAEIRLFDASPGLGIDIVFPPRQPD